jgi:hypothetical protein
MAEAGKNDGRLVFDCLSAVLLLLVAVLGEATVLMHPWAVLSSGPYWKACSLYTQLLL